LLTATVHGSIFRMRVYNYCICLRLTHFCQTANAQMPLTTAVSRDPIVVGADSYVDFHIGNANKYCKPVTIVVKEKMSDHL